MELQYNFMPQDFNEKNKEYVEKLYASYQEKFEAELRRPPHKHKDARLKTIRHYIDMMQWYLDSYDSIMAEKVSGKIRYFPTSLRGQLDPE